MKIVTTCDIYLVIKVEFTIATIISINRNNKLLDVKFEINIFNSYYDSHSLSNFDRKCC